jgi:glutamine cyclotransferase
MPKEIKEGWGLTHYTDESNKSMLLISDGSNKIYHVNPDNFEIEKFIEVKDFNGNKLDQINELEQYRDGTILANVLLILTLDMEYKLSS